MTKSEIKIGDKESVLLNAMLSATSKIRTFWDRKLDKDIQEELTKCKNNERGKRRQHNGL